QERTSASAAASSSSLTRSSRRSSVNSRPASSSRCARAISSAVARPGVSGSSCRSCSSMHSATERAPTPDGSSACTRSSTRCTSCAVLAPALLEYLDAALGGALGGLRVLGGGHLHFESARALGLLRGLEHHVRFEELADVRLQLERRQLQEPDRLLQLRGHGQLLTQLQLQ